MKGCLSLLSGHTFEGEVPEWQKGQQLFGEAVFTTGMTGYIESLTDPSYAGQILVFTYPLIGNYGVFDPSHFESKKIHLRGVVISETTENWSHHAGLCSLKEWLKEQGVFLITGVDTRELTKVLRKSGTMIGCISEHPEPKEAFSAHKPDPFASWVEVDKPVLHGKGDKRVILVDCGMKSNILRSLLQYPIEVLRVPHDYDYTNEKYDAVFLSNGPGDPEDYQKTVEILKVAMQKKSPIHGICLGSQLMALASGAKTYKLTFGHRGHNQPCKEVETGRCYITSQNHGYAIDAQTLSDDWKVTFINLNDQSVEGIAHKSLPFSTVQFHPEAAPGPTDAKWFFERFMQCL